jgi:hypothetical protein
MRLPGEGPSGRVETVPHCLRPMLALLLVGCRFDASGVADEGGGLADGTLGSGDSTPQGTGSSGGTGTGTGTTTVTPTTSTTGALTDPDPSGADTVGPIADLGPSDTTAVDDTTTGGSVCADDWWDPQWTRRRTVQVDGAGLIGASDMVALLRLDPSRIDYAQARADGADLRVVQDGTELALEIERWSPSEVSTVWVLLPALSGAGTTVTMYYGNPDAASASDGAATWPDAYVSVHHLQDFADATGAGHDAASPTPPSAIDGLLAGAQSFDGVDDGLVLAGESDYDFTTELSVEAWIRVAAFDAPWQAMVTKGDDAWRMQRYLDTAFVSFSSDPNNDNLEGDVAVDDGQFHHVAIVYGGGVKRVYVDGAQDVERELAGPISTTNHDVSIGDNVQNLGRQFSGVIDEVRISSVARDPGYFAWQFASMRDALATFGREEICE